MVQTIYSHVANLKQIRLNVKLNQECEHVFIYFETHTDAAMARRCLIENSFNIWGSKVLVDWAHRHEADMTVSFIFLYLIKNIFASDACLVIE